MHTSVTPAVSAFAVGYHDQEFRSATLGVARKFGNWQLGLGIGDAAFDGMSHRIFNPWAYFAVDDYKAYLHYESYRNGSEQSHFKKAYVLKHFNGLSLGIHTEMDFGIGPRVEFGLLDGVRLWSVVPVSRRPDEGAMKGMIGVTAEF